MHHTNLRSLPSIISPMPRGSGAIVVHRTLEQHIPGYRVNAYNSWWTLFPPILGFFSGHRNALIHAAADYGFFSSRPNCPLVVTFHNYVLDDFMKPFSSRLQWLHYRTDLRAYTKLALRYADVVTAVSAATAGLVREDLGYKGTISVIPNGVDTGRFCPTSISEHSTSEFRVLFSGNLTRRKGALLLPAIADRLDKDQRIVCIGARGVIASPFSHRKIQCLGPIAHDRMHDIYESCGTLLMPTVREGMSLAALEAMACGLPVVATNCPSMREIIEDGKGGFLCPLGNAAAFAECLIWLARNPATRAKMGAHNRQYVTKLHDSSLMIQRYRQLFNQLIYAPIP